MFNRTNRSLAKKSCCIYYLVVMVPLALAANALTAAHDTCAESPTREALTRATSVAGEKWDEDEEIKAWRNAGAFFTEVKSAREIAPLALASWDSSLVLVMAAAALGAPGTRRKWDGDIVHKSGVNLELEKNVNRQGCHLI